MYCLYCIVHVFQGYCVLQVCKFIVQQSCITHQLAVITNPLMGVLLR